jgi:L-seryl-tRNA(Ser) seleniumtransferase
VTSPYRNLPSVEALVQATELRANGNHPPRHLLVDAARAVLSAARTTIASGQQAPATEELIDLMLDRVETRLRPSLRPVINASGVIIQTNLGRAPLSDAALAAMQSIGTGYSNLEYQLDTGTRGSRYTHLADLLCQLTGAEAALAVNNNAAAIYLALTALAAGREVIISRGQAVEIGGGFRIPDVLRQSGATLIEVGTTNRTYARDYAQAITERTALLLRVHTSNFRLTGFVHETTLAELAVIGRARNVPVLDDLGSGTLLPTAPYGLFPEPTVQESIAAGADLVTFSGDKLLGGPQAGLIVGRKELIQQLQRHPLTRALRVDKTTLAGLEATLLAYVRGTALTEIPVWQMIATPAEALRVRASQLARLIGVGEVVSCESAIGGGSLPGEILPSYAVALTTDSPDRLARQLRQATPAIVTRISNDRVLFDLRTVRETHLEPLACAVRAVLDNERKEPSNE